MALKFLWIKLYKTKDERLVDKYYYIKKYKL